jgi:hypothetical protein
VDYDGSCFCRVGVLYIDDLNRNQEGPSGWAYGANIQGGHKGVRTDGKIWGLLVFGG